MLALGKCAILDNAIFRLAVADVLNVTLVRGLSLSVDERPENPRTSVSAPEHQLLLAWVASGEFWAAGGEGGVVAEGHVPETGFGQAAPLFVPPSVELPTVLPPEPFE